ncbi:MAG: FAD-dependent oxidoreductase [Campylobacterales bacterium]|nr:FAD-dependent oxidoreductase [Campylobacterales bacterium]
MSMTRRDAFKVAGATAAVAAAATFTGCAKAEGAAPAVAPSQSHVTLMPKSKGKRVVIIGAGFGGLAAAKYIRKQDASIEVVVLDRRDIFMSCPFSNSLLGGLEDVTLDTLTRDLYAGAAKYGYRLEQCTVTGIDRASKTVMTSCGSVDYDILVLSPGIDYDYKGQFPEWSDEKIRHVQQQAPAALMAGSEHLALKRMMDNMDGGNVIITVPAGKYRCPPAPFERASMIAAYMKKEGIEGKVIILNATKNIAKGKAFKEVWADKYSGLIEHRDDCTITDIDLTNNKIHYKQIVGVDKEEKEIVETKVESFAVLNFIPKNKANAVVAMSGVKTNAWGGVIMNGASFQSKDDKHVYAIGDVVGHGVPPSGQTANWTAKEAVKEIVAQLNAHEPYKLNLPYSAANVCYSMVTDGPEEAIMVTHDFSFNGTVIAAKATVPHPKDGDGKYRSKGLAKATREWYRGILDDMFM